MPARRSICGPIRALFAATMLLSGAALGAVRAGEALEVSDFIDVTTAGNAAIEPSGPTSSEVQCFGLSPPLEGSFDKGVFMSVGQRKGGMLITVLAQCKHQFKSMTFIDGHGRHVLRVYDALAQRGIAVTSIHSQREDNNVDRFRYSDKQGASNGVG